MPNTPNPECYKGLLTSARLLIDGQARGALPRVIAVEPGRHRVEVQTSDGRTIGKTIATFKAGEHVQVERLLGPQTDRWTLLIGAQATFQGQRRGIHCLTRVRVRVGLFRRKWK